MAFDQARFDTALDEIEKWLGPLKGIELVHESLVDYHKQLEADGWDLGGQCSEFHHEIGGITWEVSYPPDGAVEGLPGQLAAIYHQGFGWAAGVADRFRSLAECITKVDAGVLKETAISLEAEVASKLSLESFVPTGLKSTTTRFEGLAGEGLYDFLDEHVNPRAHMYADVTAACAAGIAVIARAFGNTQTSLVEYAEDTRAQVDKQMAAWRNASPVAFPTPSPAAELIDSDILNVLSFVNGLVGLVPNPFSGLAKANAVAGVLKSGETLPRTKAIKPPSPRADDILLTFFETFHTRFSEALRSSLDTLDAEKMSPMWQHVAEQEEQREWLTVPLPDGDTWTGGAYDQAG